MATAYFADPFQQSERGVYVGLDKRVTFLQTPKGHQSARGRQAGPKSAKNRKRRDADSFRKEVKQEWRKKCKQEDDEGIPGIASCRQTTSPANLHTRANHHHPVLSSLERGVFEHILSSCPEASAKGCCCWLHDQVLKAVSVSYEFTICKHLRPRKTLSGPERETLESQNQLQAFLPLLLIGK